VRRVGRWCPLSADPDRATRPRRPAAPIPPVLPLLIDRRTCAALLSVAERTFDRMVSCGQFPPPDVRGSAKFVRWKRGTVEAAVERLADGAAMPATV
jgi:predicted DNA-binding transcriptional regulator AlpA